MATNPETPIAKAELLPKVHPMERVEEWTVSQAADVLNGLSVSSPPPKVGSVRGTTVKIDIPLDEDSKHREAPAREKVEAVHTVYKRREPIRRDSLKRREALLKGKEGSRQRRRWENDRLLNNPWAEPPLPSDWQVQPTHAIHHVPYFLAPLWDAEYCRVSQERKKRKEEAKKPASKEDAAAAKVKQELRATLKKARGAKGLLQDLEEEVRGFVEKWEEKQRQLEKEGLIDPDSEDEEIVFIGRNGAMSDEKWKSREEETLRKDKLIFQSLVDDHGAAFGYVFDSRELYDLVLTGLSRRYLVHCIAQYYCLETWSVTRGQPARREAYVGLKTDPRTNRPGIIRNELPTPLWAVV